MARILRGDIVWADPDPTVGHEQAGRRPFLILSHVEVGAKLGVVIGLAITSKEPLAFPPPLSYELPEGLLPQRSWVLTFQIRSLAVQRLGSKLASLSGAETDYVVSELLNLIGTQ